MDVYGLVGHPIAHSLSPPMHEAAYDALDMDARYVAFEADPDRFEEAVVGASALGIAGLNVTIPFKESALDLVDPTPAAERIGAVNTIDFSTDPPRGYNTDAAGARRALSHHDVAISGQTAVVLGAGGAARAITAMLTEAGAEVHVANRTRSRAEALVDALGGTAHGLEEAGARIESADILVNATSVGMGADESPVSAATLHDELVVMDAVYSPIETRLLRDAAAAGATTIDGAWMLLFQGVEAFERWTGEDAPVEAMNAALRSRLD